MTPGLRPFALVRTADQWTRATHRDTAIDPDRGGVELAWSRDEAVVTVPVPDELGGLAFDSGCRLYRSDPAHGRIEKSHLPPDDPLRAAERPEVVELLARDPAADAGEFAVSRGVDEPMHSPRGLAIDPDDRLYVAEAGGNRILVYDLWSRRLLRAARVGARPLDLAVAGPSVWALLSDRTVVRLGARTGPGRPRRVAGPRGRARRLAAAPDGRLHALLGEWIVPLDRPGDGFRVEDAGDIEFTADGALVVARRPGENFLVFRGGLEDAPLAARGYDGLGIVRAPSGCIGFWGDRGFQHAVRARLLYARRGRATTYRLDSGEFQTQWGRLFLDACIPAGCDLRVAYATADEQGDEPTVPYEPPANAAPRKPAITPPMLPRSLAPGEADVTQPLFKRPRGRELPWARFDADDPFETYEAPVDAPPGRFLWVTLELRGTTRATPRVRSLRAEHPSHDTLRRLPKVYARDPDVADFLRRYLAIFDGSLSELESRSSERAALLDPYGSPIEILPWLASFLGLALDERWPAARRRDLVAEAASIFRLRGTPWAVKRLLDLYLGLDTIILEHFRLRGLGGALLGETAGPEFTGAVVGTSLRVGGAVGAPELGPSESAVETHAHRFTVVVPAALTAEQDSVLAHILDVHRPAHTVVTVCSIGAGMQVGRGLHVGLLSMIGRTGGWEPLRLDREALGGRAILGRGGIGGRLEGGPIDGMVVG